MKTIFNSLAISILIFANQLCISQTGWYAQTSGTSNILNSIFFIDASTGWSVGASGKILKTTNGGTNWVSQTSGTTEDLYSVFFVSSTAGWAVGTNGAVRVTGNGGSTWTSQVSGTTSALLSVYFFSGSTGWAVGDFMSICKTTNSGSTWTELLSGAVQLRSVIFTSATRGFAAGNDGYIMLTTNGGLNWTVQNSNPSYQIYSIHFPSPAIGYAVGGGSPSPPILKSTDAGLTWTILPVPSGDALNSVYFVTTSQGWAAGFSGIIMMTTNGGTNWSNQTSGTSNTLHSIFFISSMTGWSAGTILKTTTSGISAIKTIGNSIPEEFLLSQNYPNPFNPNTVINFNFPAAGIALLTVYDVLGSEVAVLVNESLKAGEYEVDWNASNYPSGVYYYKLESGSFIQTKKMILIK